MAKKITLRACVGCGEMKDKKSLVRIVKTPEGEIFPDTTGRANGRGAYICKNSDCLAKAFKNKGLERSFKSSVSEEAYNRIREEFAGIDTE
ncbi:MAG: YlxR family protein [Lachnospiraceae bacterium]|nr:YlxR family protein [Lachnospiraceae bacterium]